MARDAFPYRICAALAALFGGVFLVFTFGHVGSLSGCAQNTSAPVEAAVGDELETGASSFSLEKASSVARLSFPSAVPASIPECGPDGPVRGLGTGVARLLRLTEQDDWGTQSADPPAYDWGELSNHFASIETSADDQRAGSARVVSRAQGTLETVRSVVLRL